MFEEVPRERRGVARWLLAHSVGFGPFVLRPLAVGPFVLGGGMLLAAVGGSVAVAAAATVLTASAIGSDDLPARPQHAVAAASPSHPAPAHSSASRSTGPATAGLPAAGTSGAVAASGVVGSAAASTAAVTAGNAAAAPTRSPAGSAVPAAPVAPTRSVVPPGPAGSPTSGSAVPTPSSSAPLGNALIHVSGYDQATGRLAYQFAAASPDGNGMRYVVSGPETFSAGLAPTVAIVSGGTLCPPAGSTCTTDQLIAAAEDGFFAEVAIDVTGTLRSVLEVDDQAVTARLAPVPSSSPTPTASGGASGPS
jgi:hypothetical protein